MMKSDCNQSASIYRSSCSETTMDSSVRRSDTFDASNCGWNSTSCTLQADNSFSAKSPTSLPQTMEDLVLEFEASAQEVQDIFSIGESEIRCFNGDLLLSVCSQIPAENCKEHSNTSQDLREEEECLAYILPNETHVLAATNISESLIDPLTLAPLTYCTDIGASEECKTQVLGSTQLNPLSSSKIGKPLKSINNLTKKLAKIAHCPTSNNGEILLQASSTISKLRQQACDLMSTYTQLKFENDELLRKRKKLQFETKSNQPAMTIELLIPSKDSPKTIDSRYLYHRFPLDDDSLPPVNDEEECSELEVFMGEPYEDNYGVPDNPNVQPLPWPVTNDCPKGSSSCRFGCVCQSLELRKEYFSHSCRSPGCMLELECMRPEDPSHSFYPRVSIMNGFESRNGKKHHLSESTDHLTIQEPIAGRNRLLRKRKKDACGSSSSTTLERSSGLGISDPKLKQRCFVRLVRLDMNTIKKGSLIAYPNKTRRRTIKPAPCYRELPRRRCRSAGMGTKANGVEKKSMVSYQDWKLTAKTSVCLTRLRSKPGGTAYFCMDHQKRGCACLKL